MQAPLTALPPEETTRRLADVEKRCAELEAKVAGAVPRPFARAHRKPACSPEHKGTRKRRNPRVVRAQPNTTLVPLLCFTTLCLSHFFVPAGGVRDGLCTSGCGCRGVLRCAGHEGCAYSLPRGTPWGRGHGGGGAGGSPLGVLLRRHRA